MGDHVTGAHRSSAAAPGPELLTAGVLVARWALTTWMVVLAVSNAPRLPPVPWRVTVVCLAAATTVLLTVRRPGWSPLVLTVDLVVAVVVAVTGVLHPSFTNAYPLLAVLQFGSARGTYGGLAAGAVVGVALTATRLWAGLLPDGTGAAVTIRTAADAVNFLLAGAGFGFVATLLRRAALQLHQAQAAELRAREHAARLTERESLGRQIHDSVLQVLAMVHKRGRELAARDAVPPAEVARLAELAAEQERTLRSLILRPPGADAGTDRSTSLRAALTAAADAVSGELDVAVTAVGDPHLPEGHASELRAAVEQALRNVVQHARTGNAWVFVDEEDDEIVVTVRDDGVGFVYDEERLRAAGKYGLLRSICGRVTELGGTVAVDSAPGRGTELTLRVPRPADA